MPKVGQTLGGTYRLVRQLGKGGWGAVYEAEHRTIGKLVAIKVLRPELTENEDAVRRFVQEARAAAAIRHRSIIDIHDIRSEDDGPIYLVMELLEGASLGDELDRQGQLDINLAAYVACQVLSALDATHRKGIVHRDLKPDNIFLVRTGLALPEVKLLDFGVSKMLYPEDGAESLTQTGALVGTPHYMAPEQAAGRTDLDHRVDVYAVGVILYQCLTGALPFKGPNPMALVQEILNAPVVPPGRRREDIPPELDRIVERAMSRERERRYREASQMLAALLPFLDELAASRVPLPEDLGRWSETGEQDHPAGGLDEDTLLPEPLGEAITLEPGVEGREQGTGNRERVEELGDGDGSGNGSGGQGDGGREQPRPWTLGRGLPLFGAGVVLLAGIVSLGVWLWPHDETVTDPDAALVRSLPPDQPSIEVLPEAGAEASPEAGADQEDIVTISLAEVPEGARISLDGAPVEGTELRLPRSGALREVRVELAEHRPWRQMITPDRDRTFLVRLEREDRPRPRTGKRPPAPRGEKRPAPPQGEEPPDPAPPAPGPAGEPGFDVQFPNG